MRNAVHDFRGIVQSLHEARQYDERELKHVLENELGRIQAWAGLPGKGVFLGKGSYGAAYRFGDKVLKITFDRSEINAASIMKKVTPHPGVYRVYRTGQFKPDKEWFVSTVYAILYEYLDPPSTEIKELANRFGSSYRLVWNKTQEIDFFSEWYEGLAEHLLEMALITLEHELPTYNNLYQALDYGSPDLMGFTELELSQFVIAAAAIDDFDPYSGFDDLRDEIRETVKQGQRQIEIVDHLALAMQYIDALGILFTDVHAGNVMMRNGKPVIIDLGASRSTYLGDIEVIEGAG